MCGCLVKEETHSHIIDKGNIINKDVAIMKMLIIYRVNLWHYGGKHKIQQRAIPTCWAHNAQFFDVTCHYLLNCYFLQHLKRWRLLTWFSGSKVYTFSALQNIAGTQNFRDHFKNTRLFQIFHKHFHNATNILLCPKSKTLNVSEKQYTNMNRWWNFVWYLVAKQKYVLQYNALSELRRFSEGKTLGLYLEKYVTIYKCSVRIRTDR